MAKRVSRSSVRGVSLSTRHAQPAGTVGLSTTRSKHYTPTDSQDIAAEIAAVTGRGPNGRPSSVSDLLRRELPRAQSVDPAAFFEDGVLDSEGLRQALHAREEQEAAESDRATRDAQAEYERVLDEHRQRTRQVHAVREGVEDEFDDVDEPAPIARQPVRSKTSRLDAARKTVDVVPSPIVPAANVMMRSITDEDIDRLWDWLRVDPQPAGQFFKSAFKSSRELFEYIGQMLGRQVPIHAIDADGRHVGFFALWPIDTSAGTALLHIYVAPVERGHFDALFPYVLSGARKIIPPTMSLIMHGAQAGDAFDRLLRRYSFVPHTMFVQLGVGREA